MNTSTINITFPVIGMIFQYKVNDKLYFNVMLNTGRIILKSVSPRTFSSLINNITLTFIEDDNFLNQLKYFSKFDNEHKYVNASQLFFEGKSLSEHFYEGSDILLNTTINYYAPEKRVIESKNGYQMIIDSSSYIELDFLKDSVTNIYQLRSPISGNISGDFFTRDIILL